MIFVGDDWAEDHHDIYVMDADGARLASPRLPEGLPGIAGFHELVAGHAEEPAQVVIGLGDQPASTSTQTPSTPR